MRRELKKQFRVTTSLAVKRMGLKYGKEFTDSRNKKKPVYTWDIDFAMLALHLCLFVCLIYLRSL